MQVVRIEIEYYDGTSTNTAIITGNNLHVEPMYNMPGDNKAIRVVQNYKKYNDDNTAVIHSSKDIGYFTNINWYIVKTGDIDMVIKKPHDNKTFRNVSNSGGQKNTQTKKPKRLFI